MIRFIFLSSLLLHAVVSCGQDATMTKAYIVIGADTVAGFLKSQNLVTNPLTIQFRKDQSEDWKGYTPRDISAFSALGASFESVRTEIDFSSRRVDDLRSGNNQFAPKDSTVFLKVELKHEVLSLFTFLDKFDRLHFFVRKAGDKPRELRQKCVMVDSEVACKDQYVGILNFLFSDCKAIALDELKRVNLTTTDLRKVSLKYIKCITGREPVEKEVEIQKNGKFGVSLFVGPGLNQLQFTAENSLALAAINEFISKGYGSAFTFQAGVGLEYRARLNPKLGLGMELGIRHYNTQGDDESSAYRHFRVDATYLKISPQVSYRFWNSTVSPYIKGGLSYNAALIIESNYEFQTVNSVGVVSKTQSDLIPAKDVSNSEGGFFGALGVSGRRLALELRCEWSTGIVKPNFGGYGSRTQSQSIYLSYQMNKWIP